MIAGWVVMGLFLLAGMLTILLSTSEAQFENLFLGVALPMALLALAIGIMLLVSRS